VNDTPFRVRVCYSKTGNLRFIGHLDTQRLFERALRRSTLPIRYTQGFSKHIRLNLASALPLGFIGRAEMLDFWLDEPMDPQEIHEKLQNALPGEIHILELYQVENSLPSLQGSLLSSDYIITLTGEESTQEFQQKWEQMLSQMEIPITRREKTLDYKALILQQDLQVDSLGKMSLKLRLWSKPG
jgi:radical SAM-linked protein